MRVWDGMKESFKKKLMRSVAGHMGMKWEMKNWQREQVPRKWRENGGEEDRRGIAFKVT